MLLVRQILTIRRTIAVADDERSAWRRIAARHCVAGGHAGQENVERERVSSRYFKFQHR
jgi:hypothetical protein